MPRRRMLCTAAHRIDLRAERLMLLLWALQQTASASLRLLLSFFLSFLYNIISLLCFCIGSDGSILLSSLRTLDLWMLLLLLLRVPAIINS